MKAAAIGTFVLLLGFGLVGCGSDPNEEPGVVIKHKPVPIPEAKANTVDKDLVGVWQAEALSHTGTGKPNRQEQILASHYQLTLNADKTCHLVVLSTVDGEWKIEDNKLVVVLRNASDAPGSPPNPALTHIYSLSKDGKTLSEHQSEATKGPIWYSFVKRS